MRRRAFTLVELLVVVGIIALLVAILFPVLSKAREQANRIKCAANLRSLGHAMTMYTLRYGYYPAAYVAGSSGWAATWPVQMRPFLGGNTSVFSCPSQDAKCDWPSVVSARAPAAHAEYLRQGYEPAEPLLLIAGLHFGYGYNVWGADQTAHDGLGAVDPLNPFYHGLRRTAEVKSPVEMIAVMDSDASGYGDMFVIPWTPSAAEPGNVHGKGANVLFCDGHVTWYLKTDLVFNAWDERAVFAAKRRMWSRLNSP